MLQWSYNKAVTRRSGTHWQIYGPVYYVLAGNIFSMMLPLATLFIYVGKFGYPGSKMWKGSKWFPNTPHGIFFYAMKFVGTISLMVGVVQVTGLHIKIKKRWNELRNVSSAVKKVVDIESLKLEEADATALEVSKTPVTSC